MFENLCALPLSSDLFVQALHPREPLLAVGLASGHVQTYRLPTDSDSNNGSSNGASLKHHALSNGNGSHGQEDDDDEDDDDDNTASLSLRPRRSSLSSRSSPTPLITSEWRTRRHKGSSRALGFSAVDGRYLISGGTDGLVKCADSTTGKVVAKIAVPVATRSALDPPCTLLALTPTSFLLATDSGAVHLYDTRAVTPAGGDKSPFFLSTRPANTWTPHEDFASSITAVPASSTSTSGLPRAFVSTGGATVALTDLRKGIVGTSSEAIEPLTASAISYPANRLVVADAAGFLTSWDRSQAASWSDGLSKTRVDVRRFVVSPEGTRLPVSRMDDDEAGIDVLCSVPDNSPASKNLSPDTVVLGWDTGRVEVVALRGKGGRTTNAEVITDFPPDAEREGIVGLGFDSVGRLVVGAGQKVVIYAHSNSTSTSSLRNNDMNDSDDDSESDQDPDSDSDSDDDEKPSKPSKPVPRPIASKAKARRPARFQVTTDDAMRTKDDDDQDSENDDNDEDEDEEDEEEERERPAKKKRKRKGAKAQKNHPSFNFAGLD